MSGAVQVSPRERILQAASALLEQGGPDRVSTRAVSAAAQVQAPTIYRQFGDMQGLLDAVASAGFTAYLEGKRSHALATQALDPVAQLREGMAWHIEFGLTHPHLYRLMYGGGQDAHNPAALEGAAMLRALLERVAQTGRLKVSVEQAAHVIHAAVSGVVLTLLGLPQPDPALTGLMEQAVLGAVLTDWPGTAEMAAEPSSLAAHAVAVAAHLKDPAPELSVAEQQLLLEWLRRLM